MSYRENLLKAADSYCAKTARARSGLGLLILNDSKFFDRIHEGAGCTMETYEKVMQWFKENPAPKVIRRAKKGTRA